MPENAKVVSFITEVEKLMIAFRIENGKLLWNADDIQARDAVVSWARKSVHQSKTDTLGHSYGKPDPGAVVMEKMEAALKSDRQ